LETNRETIWIVEDQLEAQFIYREILSPQYSLRFFERIETFLIFSQARISRKSIKEEIPKIIIADLKLPDGSFLDFMKQNDFTPHLAYPLIVVSSVDDLDTLRSCFHEGALDYLTKPFSKSELLVRIERILIKNLKCSAIQLDNEKLQIRTTRPGVAQLTLKELQIFSILKRTINVRVSRQQIQQSVWGDTKVGGKTLDVHLFNIRKKIHKLGLQIDHAEPDGFKLLCDTAN
jgi:DNA-binding response OmpR family regulator